MLIQHGRTEGNHEKSQKINSIKAEYWICPPGLRAGMLQCLIYRMFRVKNIDYFHLHSLFCPESTNLHIGVAVEHRMKECGDCEEKNESRAIYQCRPILWPADGSLYKLQAGQNTWEHPHLWRGWTLIYLDRHMQYSNSRWPIFM